MTMDIYSQNHGRGLSGYDLLDQIEEQFHLSRTDAHDAIHAMLNGIIEAEGESVILNRRPARPELLTDDAPDVDIDHWLTISDETAAEICEALVSAYSR